MIFLFFYTLFFPPCFAIVIQIRRRQEAECCFSTIPWILISRQHTQYMTLMQQGPCACAVKKLFLLRPAKRKHTIKLTGFAHAYDTELRMPRRKSHIRQKVFFLFSWVLLSRFTRDYHYRASQFHRKHAVLPLGLFTSDWRNHWSKKKKINRTLPHTVHCRSKRYPHCRSEESKK